MLWCNWKQSQQLVLVGRHCPIQSHCVPFIDLPMTTIIMKRKKLLLRCCHDVVHQKTNEPMSSMMRKRMCSVSSSMLSSSTSLIRTLCLTMVLSSLQFSSITCLTSHHECPSHHLLKSLVPQSEDSTSIDCYCTYDPSHEREGGGWDISCMKQLRSSSSSSRQVNSTNIPNPETVIKNNRPGADDDDFIPSDLHYSTLESSAFEFTIKHESKRAIEISCYDSSPDFKPAMFQGSSFIFSASLFLSS